MSTQNLPTPPRPSRDWFSDLFGFAEIDWDSTSNHPPTTWIQCESDEKGKEQDYLKLRSLVNSKTYKIGKFTTPSLAEVRAITEDKKLMSKPLHEGRLSLKLQLGDVSGMQADPENKYSTFQAASQFNCLEFVSPRIRPEQGVTRYRGDHTQGPACSISAGPATVYRNWFAPVLTSEGKRQDGQTEANQINNLKDFNIKLGNNPEGKYFNVVGGYTQSQGTSGLAAMNEVLGDMSPSELEALKDTLRVGAHQDVQVTSSNWGRNPVLSTEHLITQVFGSACSIAYDRNPTSSWAEVAKIILDASYEATFHIALQAADRHQGAEGSRKLFLTAVGGGVFGNDMSWIADSIDKACVKFKDCNLDVRMVQYSQPVANSLQTLISKHQ